ncbi:MAG: hypothetical protein JRM90_07390 [Nitrososphaerota archaeon]|nr:hypothetical protein [Nitrososphaerota archaeon]
MRDDLLVRLASAYGPRSRSKIARRLGVSNETVARAFARLEAEGLEPRPDIRMEMLGLRRFAVFARPDVEGDRQALHSLFNLMGDYAYLEHYQKLDPCDKYLLIFSIPPGMLRDLREFLGTLKSRSILDAGVPLPLSWVRYHPIRGPWKDVASLEPATSGPLAYVPQGEAEIHTGKVSYMELLLLSALQADPDENLPGLLQVLSEWAGAGYEDVARCLGTVSGWSRGLKGALRFVDSFPVHLSRGEPGAAKRRRHGWASFTAWWEGLRQEEILRSAMSSTSIPYLRTDGACVRSGFYFSVVSAPSRMIPGYLDFLNENAPERMNVAVPSHFLNFSLPFPSFSPEEGHWTWKKERLQALLATLQTA